MEQRKRHETSILKRIQRAVSRFESFGDGLVSGSPESLQRELERIFLLRDVIRRNLAVAERLAVSRQTLQRIKEIEERESKSRGLLTTILQGALSEGARAEIEGLKARLPKVDMRTDFCEEVSADDLRAYDNSLEDYERLLAKSISAAMRREPEWVGTAERHAAECGMAGARSMESGARMGAMTAAHAEDAL
jgi:hypothetical protein